ncbi:hypothetical protein CBS147332_3839 [Penicillium roqueforti]|nr:hypothetical protein CBS147332_3839 [Penicillium roqueforti]KAI3112041.1 hypothetical protein CBS147331_4595 [Penicillium roqueforti]
MPPKYTLFDSEAEGEAPSTPSHQILEKSLRDQVAAIFKAGNLEELTVKRVRLAAENSLGLTAGYFKTTGDWKARSEDIIKDEVVSLCLHLQCFFSLRSFSGKTLIAMLLQGIQDQAILDPQSQTPSPSKAKPTALAKRAKSETATKPRKRQKTKTPVSDEEDELPAPPSETHEVPKPKNRSKAPIKKAPGKKVSVQKHKDMSDGSDFPGDESDDVAKPNKRSSTPVTKSPLKKSPAKKASVPKLTEDVSDVPDDALNATKTTKDTKDDSESEMSVVLDEEPQPKAPRKRQRSAGETATKTKKKATKATKAKEEDISPDQAEIKRLQGWLVKCGIRKLWGKELAPYDTPNAKIKHLKGMLQDAGMTGRPSQEKANQIREERELKADLEQIQQGAKQWGAVSDEDNDEEAKPRRRLGRGRQSLAFLESEGEETD